MFIFIVRRLEIAELTNIYRNEAMPSEFMVRQNVAETVDLRPGFKEQMKISSWSIHSLYGCQARGVAHHCNHHIVPTDCAPMFPVSENKHFMWINHCSIKQYHTYLRYDVAFPIARIGMGNVWDCRPKVDQYSGETLGVDPICYMPPMMGRHRWKYMASTARGVSILWFHISRHFFENENK